MEGIFNLNRSDLSEGLDMMSVIKMLRMLIASEPGAPQTGLKRW